jgi:putative Ca2+/H+ antiporter (TMEM165/GDT1 family)
MPPIYTVPLVTRTVKGYPWYSVIWGGVVTALCIWGLISAVMGSWVPVWIPIVFLIFGLVSLISGIYYVRRAAKDAPADQTAANWEDGSLMSSLADNKD